MPIVTIQKEQVISQDEKTITIDLPETLISKRKTLDYSKVEAARGILREKADKMLAHVKRLRREWE